MDNIVVKIIGGSEKKKLKSCILSLVKHHSLVVETANSLESFVNEVSLKNTRY